jgi:hypothetical protein
MNTPELHGGLNREPVTLHARSKKTGIHQRACVLAV